MYTYTSVINKAAVMLVAYGIVTFRILAMLYFTPTIQEPMVYRLLLFLQLFFIALEGDPFDSIKRLIEQREFLQQFVRFED